MRGSGTGAWRANGLALLVLALVVAAFLWLRQSGPSDPFSREGMLELAERLGPWAPTVFALVVALAVVVSQVPGVPLTVAAGALWGPGPATAYAVAGGFLGGMIAYFLGRTLGRGAIRALTGKVVVFSKDRGEAYLGWVLLVSRMLPVLSFDLVSYAAGMSGLSVRIYAAATLVGMIPSTFLLTLLGAHFTVRPLVALALSGVALLGIVALPVLTQRYGWFSDLVRVEDGGSAAPPGQ